MMGAFLAYYLRGLVYGIVFFTLIAVVIGFCAFVASYPTIGVPILILVVMPLAFGSLGGD